VLYTSNGHGGWTSAHGTKIGSGWNVYPTFISPGDWNGDNLIDLVGISRRATSRCSRTDRSGGGLNGHGDAMTGGLWKASAFDGL